MNNDVFSEHVKNAFDTSNKLPWGINPIDYDNFLPISAPAIAMCMSGINYAEETRGVDKTTFYGYFRPNESNKVELTGSVSDFENTIKLSPIKCFHLYVRDLQNAIEGLVSDENYPDTMEDYMRRCFDYRWRLSGVPAAMRIDNNVPITTVSGVVNIDFYDRVSSGLWPMTWQEISGVTSFVGIDLAGTNRTSNLDEFITAPSGRDVGGQIIKGLQSSEFSTENLPSRAEGHHQYGPMMCPIWILQSLIWGPAQAEKFYIDQVQPSGANENNFCNWHFACRYLRSDIHYPEHWDWIKNNENSIDPRPFSGGSWGNWIVENGRWSSNSGIVTITNSGIHESLPTERGVSVFGDGGNSIPPQDGQLPYVWHYFTNGISNDNGDPYPDVHYTRSSKNDAITVKYENRPTSLDYPIEWNFVVGYPPALADIYADRTASNLFFNADSDTPIYHPGKEDGLWFEASGYIQVYAVQEFNIAWSNIPVALREVVDGRTMKHERFFTRRVTAEEFEAEDFEGFYVSGVENLPVYTTIDNWNANNLNDSQYAKIRFGPGSKLITDASGIEDPRAITDWFSNESYSYGEEIGQRPEIIALFAGSEGYFGPVYGVKFLSSSHINYDETEIKHTRTRGFKNVELRYGQEIDLYYQQAARTPVTDSRDKMRPTALESARESEQNSFNLDDENVLKFEGIGGFKRNFNPVGNENFFNFNSGCYYLNENFPSGAIIEDMWRADKYYPNTVSTVEPKSITPSVRESFRGNQDHLGATMEQLNISVVFENKMHYFNNGNWGAPVELFTTFILEVDRDPPYDPDFPDQAYTNYYRYGNELGKSYTRNRLKISLNDQSEEVANTVDEWNPTSYPNDVLEQYSGPDTILNNKMQISKVIVTFPTILKTSDPEVAYSGVG